MQWAHMLITVNDLKKYRSVCKLWDDSGLKATNVCDRACVCVGHGGIEILKKKTKMFLERRACQQQVETKLEHKSRLERGKSTQAQANGTSAGC